MGCMLVRIRVDFVSWNGLIKADLLSWGKLAYAVR